MSDLRSAEPLSGVGILVTRPRQQSQALLRRLGGIGARPLCFPLLVIEPLPLPAPAELCGASGARSRMAWTDLLRRLDSCVFTSVNAVQHARPLVDALSAACAAGHGPRVAAVGQATAAALQRSGIEDVITPATSSDSEGLLEALAGALPSAAQVLLVGGEGGRRLLDQALLARGARVLRLAAYRRRRPCQDLNTFLDRHAAEIQMILTSSGEALDNLLDLAAPRWRPWLLQRPLVVSHTRHLQRCRRLGFQGPVRAATSMSDPALLEALRELWCDVGSRRAT
ncbi:MAG: uroporphyrinogen-III synthase [Gammaproteobacteria bacterium]|nr:uroporphyrinogen-III synthase [Gammaproteobacteria bacterium]